MSESLFPVKGIICWTSPQQRVQPPTRRQERCKALPMGTTGGNDGSGKCYIESHIHSPIRAKIIRTAGLR